MPSPTSPRRGSPGHGLLWPQRKESRLRCTGVAVTLACIVGYCVYAATMTQPVATVAPLPVTTRHKSQRKVTLAPVPNAKLPPPPTAAPAVRFACAAEDHPPAIPAASSTEVSAVVIAIPFIESVSSKHAWYDAARTTTPVSVPFEKALPVAALDRFTMVEQDAAVCTIVVVFPDVSLPTSSPPFVRDQAVEAVVARRWPHANAPASTATECRRCGKVVRRVIALRARVKDSALADQQHAAFAALTHVFEGTIDSELPRPAAAAFVNGDTYPEDAGDTFARGLSNALAERNGNAIVGSVLTFNNAVVSAGFSATDRQLTGGAGLTDRFQGIFHADARINQPRAVHFLPHGAFAVTARTWKKLHKVQRGGTGPSASSPIIDRAPPQQPDPEALAIDIALATAATRGVLASLHPYVTLLKSLAAGLPDSGAKATALRVNGACRRVELAANAGAELLSLSRSSWHWRKRVDPAVEPLQETMLMLQCGNKVVDAITDAHDFDIPGIVSGEDGDFVLASGSEITLPPLIVLLMRPGDRLSAGRKFFPKASLETIDAAYEALRRFEAVKNEAAQHGASLRHCRACVDTFASLRCQGYTTDVRTHAERCGRQAEQTVMAIKAAHNATLAAVAFIENFVTNLHSRHHQFERLCSSAWSVSPWAQLNTAAARAGVPRIAVRTPGALLWPKPDGTDVPVADSEALEYASLLQFNHANWLPLTVGVGADDPVLLDVEKEVTSAYLTTSARVQWGLPCDCAGITVEATWILTGMRKYVEVRQGGTPLCFCPGPRGSTLETIWSTFNYGRSAVFRWRTLLGIRQPGMAEDVVDVHVAHWDPIAAPHIVFGPEPTGGDYHIIRTMYEFSKIPPEWIEPLNSDRWDEIWVPCAAVANIFINAGIEAAKVEIVPEPIDAETFDADRVSPLPLPPPNAIKRAFLQARPDEEVASSFKFCSVFKFEERKGWRALIDAYVNHFHRADSVSLFIVGFLTELPKGARDPADPDAIRLTIEMEAAKHGKIHLSELPYVEVLTSRLTDDEMAQLYRTCDAFVLPTHGEGWGLPVMQAMAMGLPVITTNTTGISAFTTKDTVMYVNHAERELPQDLLKQLKLPAGTTWSAPDPSHLGALMKQLRLMSAGERANLGQRAMEHIKAEFSHDRIGLEIAERVVGIERKVRRRWAARGRPAGKPGPDEDASRLEVKESNLARLRPKVL